MKVLLCPICNKKPNDGSGVKIQCCGLIVFDSNSCKEYKYSLWNNMVIEYRKMIALEKIANNPPWYTYSSPATYTYPPTLPMTNNINYDENGVPIYG